MGSQVGALLCTPMSPVKSLRAISSEGAIAWPLPTGRCCYLAMRLLRSFARVRVSSPVSTVDDPEPA